MGGLSFEKYSEDGVGYDNFELVLEQGESRKAREVEDQ